MAQLREMERDQKRGTLLPAAEVRKVWADRLSARLANRPESEVRGVLRDALEECLGGIHADAQTGL